MPNFPLIFSGILAVNVLVTVLSSERYKNYNKKKMIESSTSDSNSNSPTPAVNEEQRQAWQRLVRKYLLVYLLATLSDWLQGPYVYALYSDYGYSQHDIAVLFVAGFGSSMVFGSFVGGMADWGGRRTFAVLFAVVYACSCLTKRT
jgi:predicted MFS family arabinose efflux permease